MAKTGRPKNDNSRKGQVRVRLNEKEEKMLDEVSEALNKSRSEIIREFIQHMHDTLSKEVVA